MNEAQTKAWDCLKENEKQSLFLQCSEGKSSWESGNIMGVTHYKYLEIRERANKFFRMFTEFFTKYPAIFRPDSPCQSKFIDYIEASIEGRESRKDASIKSGDSSTTVTRIRNNTITKNMELLKVSEDPWDLDTRRLIFEFDRWNNHRILPEMLQQPSPYKRRINKKAKIYLKYLLNRLPQFALERVRERFYYKTTKPTSKKYWVCLINEIYTDGYFLLPIRPNKDIIDEMSRLYLYVFESREDADTFGFMVSSYSDRTYTIKRSQKFWPEFRLIESKAINYNVVNNIEFSVRNLDRAYEVKTAKPKPPKIKSACEKRAAERAFYKSK